MVRCACGPTSQSKEVEGRRRRREGKAERRRGETGGKAGQRERRPKGRATGGMVPITDDSVYIMSPQTSTCFNHEVREVRAASSKLPALGCAPRYRGRRSGAPIGLARSTF
jgi:hypothetical protein